MNDEIKVTVICLTYNHQKYIRDCLKGFIMQKTNFAFEVLVHDDASTDKTANIIREFETKYPNLIKPIYQKENQYSKGKTIIDNFINPHVKGKYIALCEGDDVWTDENKLQCQVDYLDLNEECFCVTHSFIQHNCVTGKDLEVIRSEIDRDFSLKEIVDGGGALFATNSLCVRKEVLLEMPECFKSRYFGDFQIPIYAAILGKVHYQKEIMSQYNAFAVNSWSRGQHYNDKKAQIIVAEVLRLLIEVNNFYNNKFYNSFEETIEKSKIEIKFYEKKYKEIKNSNYYKVNKNKFSKAFRIKVYLGSISPKLLELIINLKRKLDK